MYCIRTHLLSSACFCRSSVLLTFRLIPRGTPREDISTPRGSRMAMRATCSGSCRASAASLSRCACCVDGCRSSKARFRSCSCCGSASVKLLLLLLLVLMVLLLLLPRLRRPRLLVGGLLLLASAEQQSSLKSAQYHVERVMWRARSTGHKYVEHVPVLSVLLLASLLLVSLLLSCVLLLPFRWYAWPGVPAQPIAA